VTCQIAVPLDISSYILSVTVATSVMGVTICDPKVARISLLGSDAASPAAFAIAADLRARHGGSHRATATTDDRSRDGDEMHAA
jgi:hypothetical protein